MNKAYSNDRLIRASNGKSNSSSPPGYNKSDIVGYLKSVNLPYKGISAQIRETLKNHLDGYKSPSKPSNKLSNKLPNKPSNKLSNKPHYRPLGRDGKQIASDNANILLDHVKCRRGRVILDRRHKTYLRSLPNEVGEYGGFMDFNLSLKLERVTQNFGRSDAVMIPNDFYDHEVFYHVHPIRPGIKYEPPSAGDVALSLSHPGKTHLIISFQGIYIVNVVANRNTYSTNLDNAYRIYRRFPRALRNARQHMDYINALREIGVTVSFLTWDKEISFPITAVESTLLKAEAFNWHN